MELLLEGTSRSRHDTLEQGGCGAWGAGGGGWARARSGALAHWYGPTRNVCVHLLAVPSGDRTKLLPPRTHTCRVRRHVRAEEGGQAQELN